jgi:N-acyl homoserine lactone hydrolase
MPGCRPAERVYAHSHSSLRLSVQGEKGEVAVQSRWMLATLCLLPLFAEPVIAQTKLERLYVIDCGERTAPDVAPWTPGVNVGRPVDFVDTCYLIKHGTDWMAWDTGLTDAIYAAPSADPNAWKRTKSLAGELEKIGVKPSDVKFVAVSHTHSDHIGNVELFPQALLLVQKAEYDWPGQDNKPRFLPSHPVKTLEGDYDVFGDGSVMLISTPGHTPGHQSLLIKLPQTGAVLLSGDAVHLKDNWEAKRVPAINVDKEKSAASMQRMSELMEKNKAQLWINHDKPQSLTMKRPPEFYQ